MPIDFKQQTFFDPKIDIIGKEVPLAEIEKTGNVLQNRFDESYKQYSAADEALKQMEARANPVDREKAKELRGIYKGEMDKILEQGDFHNMRHQTENLARNAAINYKVIEEKNAAIQKGLEEIAKSPKYQLDPEGAKQEYLKSIQSINFNPETRTISDFNVGAYNAAADFQTADKLLQIAPTLRAKLLKAKGSYFGTRTLPTGEKVNTIETEGGGYRILDNEEIEKELKSYIVTDPAFQAYITRDVGRMGLDPKSEEGKVAYDQLVAERTADTSKALGKMYEIDENMAQGTFTPVPASVTGSGNNKPDYSNVTPINTVADALGINPNEPLRVTLNKGLTTEKYNLNKISEFADEYIDMAKKTKNKDLEQKYSEFKNLVKQAGNLSKEDREALAPLFIYGMYGKGSLFGSQTTNMDTAVDILPAKLKPLGAKLYAFANKKLFDTDTEEAFKAFNASNKGMQNVNLNAINIQDQETNNKVQSFIDKSTASNDFESFKGELKKDAKYTLAKVSDRPLGNGTGILFELKDQGTGETILVYPKDSRMLKSLYGIFPGVENDIFKNTSDFAKGETRTIAEIFKENNFEMPKEDPNKETSIRFTKDGKYQKLDKKGTVIKEANHFVDLIN